MRCLACDECGFLAKKERGRLGAFPSPLWGGVRGGGRCSGQHQCFTASPPSPTLPHEGGGSTLSVRQPHRDEISRRPDEIDHGGFVGLRREADGGGAGGGERLRDLARETKLHRRERALENAGASGAELSLKRARSSAVRSSLSPSAHSTSRKPAARAASAVWRPTVNAGSAMSASRQGWR